MEGASRGFARSAPSLGTGSERRWDQQRRTDPRYQDLETPGTPNGLGSEQEYYVTGAFLHGCDLEFSPGPWGISLLPFDSLPSDTGQLVWVDSIAVDDKTMTVLGSWRLPTVGGGYWQYWPLSSFRFRSEEHAEQAERAMALCRNTG
jgi:hypothetical protein